MKKLWTPPGTALPRATLPEGDVTLANGIVLSLERGNSAHMQEAYRRMGHVAAALAVYGARTGMRVIASVDQTDRWGPLLHVSLSYRDRNPSWTEIRLVKDAFYGPNRGSMMILPKADYYVNLMKHCFHLWETPETWDIT